MNEKACTQCGKVKKLDEFHLDPKGRYGRQSYCKPCQVYSQSVNSHLRRVARIASLENKVRIRASITGTPTAIQHCHLVGLRSVKELARFHDVTVSAVGYWRRDNPELFDRKLAEAAVMKRKGKQP